jgi:hypothetical protein
LRLGNKDSKFEMTVIGYQFPQLGHKQYDADWLKIKVSAKHPRGSWVKTDPCLLTWELAELAVWFHKIAENNSGDSNIEFMEPELRFEWFRESQNTLRVHLSYSLRPVWSPYSGPDAENDLYIDFAPNPETLKQIANSLREAAERFPVRVGT